MYTTPDTQSVQRHPIRGLLWGLLFGVGLTGILILTNVVAIGTLAPWVVLIFSVLFGIAWGLFAPPKKVKGDPPLDTEPLAPTEPEVQEPPAEPEVVAAEAPAADPSQEPIVKPADPSESPATIIDTPTEPEQGDA